jgi:hypothetical protein
MNKCVDDNLTDLNLVSLLTEGVKISVRNGRIFHELPKGENILHNVLNSTKRWFHNDNRKSGVQELYAIVKQSLVLIKENLETNSYYYKKYMEIFPKVIAGIENYKRTYQDDAYITSRCTVIIDAINSVQET